MADAQAPAKDISAVFKRLKSNADNKKCFDCGALNPTWASTTYGVFLCIDCSAVHRGLGVHLTFIRSINLDTTWTWTQLKKMQLGGNAKAMAFFRQHNLDTSDSKAKYNSRVAAMYRDRLAAAVQKDIQVNGCSNINPGGGDGVSKTPEEKDVDFFENIEENFSVAVDSPSTTRANAEIDAGLAKGNVDVGHLSSSPPKKDVRVPTIGGRKKVPTAKKKTGLGAKKGGLGATKSSVNFSDIETAALNQDKMKETAEKEFDESPAPAADIKDQPLSESLVYKTSAMKKEEERIREQDPKKLEQLERLGMGYGSQRNSAFSHSVSGSMQSVEQVNGAKEKSDDKYFSSSNNGFFSSYETPVVTDAEPPRYDSYADSWGSSGSFGNKNSTTDREDTSRSRSTGKPTSFSSDSSSMSAEDQNRFKNSKGISSDQMFGSNKDNETSERLDRYSGSSGIGSSDLFGEQSKSSSYSSQIDYATLKENVTNVTGKLSTMASGVIGSLQTRYSGKTTQ